MDMDDYFMYRACTDPEFLSGNSSHGNYGHSTYSSGSGDNHIVSRGFEEFLGWCIFITGIVLACVYVYVLIWSNFKILEDGAADVLAFFGLPFIIILGWVIVSANRQERKEEQNKEEIK